MATLLATTPGAVQPVDSVERIVKTCVPRYVRALTCVEDGEKMEKEAFVRFLGRVKGGKAFVEDEEMVVAMIDISGYSKVASALVHLGKVSSELLAHNVGKYLKQLMGVVNDCSGDVIKFLGDAILVTFTRTTPNEDIALVALRAAACCARCLLEHRYHQIDVEETMRKNSLSGKRETFRNMDFKLSLHIGMLLGNFQHVILGDFHRRLDYCIYGEALSEFSELLDGTVAGEMAMGGLFVQALEKLLEWPLDVAVKASEGRTGSVVLNVDKNMEIFNLIKQRHVQVFKPNSLTRKVSTANSFMANNGLDELSMGGFKSRTNSTFEPDAVNSGMNVPLKVATSMGEDHSTKMSAVSLYSGLPDPLCRFVNTSFLSRLGVVGPARFTTDYRRVSVLFAKLKGPFNVDRAQGILVAFIEAVAMFNGVFQHFSIDDKGQNILAFFGLPPFTFENSALFAAKAAAKFASCFEGSKALAPAISVGTGDCLNEFIGTPERKEIFVMGDFINVAARLLSVHSDVTYIIIDNDTKELVDKDFRCFDIGNIRVKGKDAPIQVWGLLGSENMMTRGSIKGSPLLKYIGYEQETAQLLEGYSRWKRSSEGFWSVVQGESGSGKSCLMSKVSKAILEDGTQLLLSRGSEVEQWTPYFGLQSILCYILKLSRASNPGGFLFTRSQSIASRTQSLASENSRLSGKGIDYELDEFETLLMQCGEDPNYAPLLAQTLPWLKYQCDDSIEKLTKAAKNSITSNIYLKLLGWYLSKGSCVLVVDDAQWVDSVSMYVFNLLFLSQAAHCCLIFSRPITADVENGLDKIAGLPHVSNISINGLNKEDSKLFMTRLLKADSVPQDIANSEILNICELGTLLFLTAIFARTNGNIIQTQMICESLFAQREKIFEEPLTCNNIKDPVLFEKIVLGSTASIISSQLDKLHPDFQKLLKNASILGQYFCLEDVAYLFQPEEITVDALVTMIRADDKFRYLSFSVNGLDSGVDSTIGKTFCSFRHIRIMYAIYESISMAERTLLHERIAELLEILIDQFPASRKQLLPNMDILKESGVYYSKCVDYFTKFPLAPISAARKALIYAKLSFCLGFPLISIDRGMAAAAQALRIAGEEWGDDPKSIAEISKRDLKRFFKFWILSNQGQKEIVFKKAKDRALYREWYPLIRWALYALSVIALCDVTMRPEMKSMIFVKILIFALTEAESQAIFLFSMLNIFVYGLFINPSKSKIKLARYFSKKIEKIRKRCSEYQLKEHYLLYGGAEIFLNNRPSRGIAVFKDLLDFSTEIRKLTYVVRSYAWVWIAHLCFGHLNVPTLYKHPWLSDLVREDPVWLANAMYGPLTCTFVMGRAKLYEEYLKFQADVFKVIPAKSLLLVRIHHHVFELMGLMLNCASEQTVTDKLVEVLSDCDTYLAKEPDVTLSYTLVFCLLAVPEKLSANMRGILTEAVRHKISFYKECSIQGHVSNFNYFLMQTTAYRLGVAKPPTSFARFLRSEKKGWAFGGEYGFLQTLGQAVLAVHCPKLMKRKLTVAEVCSQLRLSEAELLESWVKGERLFVSH
ncbi:hypothetical protein HDU97_010293 [Phlyctochytrium planicorne]|nr:hypothetical protein HDU97_010293 [Phlyctochytrium planicorne]